MQIHRKTIELDTAAGTDIHDLSPTVSRFLAESGVENGMLLVFVPGSTAGITTIEFESGAVADLEAAIERIAPSDLDYAHDRRWGDGNGFSHVRAALMGPSASFPVVDAALVTGTWQQIVLCDFDNRPRRRRVILQVIS
jgi:secondary thiamine-phosphate synthase enzyme